LAGTAKAIARRVEELLSRYSGAFLREAGDEIIAEVERAIGDVFYYWVDKCFRRRLRIPEGVLIDDYIYAYRHVYNKCAEKGIRKKRGGEGGESIKAREG